MLHRQKKQQHIRYFKLVLRINFEIWLLYYLEFVKTIFLKDVTQGSSQQEVVNMEAFLLTFELQ